MNNLPPDIQARRAIEDRAAKLAAERAALQAQSTAITHAMIDLVRDAKGSGIPYEQLAGLLGVTRQTVFTWREVADGFQPGETASEALSKRAPEGALRHYKG